MSACLVIAPGLAVEKREGKDLPDAAHVSALWALASQHLRPHHGAPARDHGAAERADLDATIAPHCWLELERSSGGRRTKIQVACFDDARSPHRCATTNRRRSLIGATSAMRRTFALCRARSIGSRFLVLIDDDVVGIGPAFVLELEPTVSAATWLAHALGELSVAIAFSKLMNAVVRCPDTMPRHLDRCVQCVVACTG